MNKTVQDAVNDQIQAELVSAYLYLAMAAEFDNRNFKGFAHWLRVQWQEETEHAMKFFDHLLERGGQVQLKTIDQPQVNFNTPFQAFEKVLEHEQYITRRIYELYDLANKERDYPILTLLHWFINEQVEEEQNATEILEKLRMIGDNKSALFFLDHQLGSRSS